MSGVGAHMTPSNRKRKRADRSVTKAYLQGRRKVCRNGTKSNYVCSGCTDEGSTNIWLCHSDTGRDFFGKHLSNVHLPEYYFTKNNTCFRRDINITLRLSRKFLFGCILFLDPTFLLPVLATLCRHRHPVVLALAMRFTVYGILVLVAMHSMLTAGLSDNDGISSFRLENFASQ